MTANSPVTGSSIGSLTGTSLVAILATSTYCLLFDSTARLPRPPISGKRSDSHVRSQVRVDVDDFGHVCSARPGVQVRQHAIGALLLLEFGYFAGCVIDVAEDDGVGRAGLLASCHDFAIAYLAVVLVGIDFDFVDALHTVAALLHDAAAANRDVGVAHQLQAWRFKVGEEQEIEPPDFIRAVVGAVTGAHAAVVDHHVEAFGRVNRGSDRADLLAGGVLALVTGHGLEVRARRRKITIVVSVDANPLHDAAPGGLVLADYGDVVLRIATYDTGVAAHAGIHVDGHAPGVLVVAIRREHAVRRLKSIFAITLVREILVLLELVERGVADDAAVERFIAFNRVRPAAVAADIGGTLIDVMALGNREAP